MLNPLLVAVRRPVLVALTCAGGGVPYIALTVFIAGHGLDIPLLVQQVFATPGSTFFALDVIFSAVALLVVLAMEWGSVRRPWLVVVAAVAVGPSCGLPLWVMLRRGSGSGDPH